MEGHNHVIPVSGPLSTSLEGINLFMQTVIGAKPWLVEPSLLPIPWETEDLNVPPTKPLKIGVMYDDGVVRPHPPILRALKEVVERLKKVPNVEVVEWKPYKHEEAWSIIASLYFPDGGEDVSKPVYQVDEPLRPMSTHILKDNEYVKRHSIGDLWAWQHKRDVYCAEYAEHWNRTALGVNSTGNLEQAVDVILCPAGPGVAPLLDTAKWWGYTSQCERFQPFNIISY